MTQTSAAAAFSLFASGRSCEGCTLCCTLLGVGALGKPRNVACAHCAEGAGCGIYETRPLECAQFICTWLYAANVGAHWRPADSGLMLHFDRDVNRMEIHVDPARPGGWRAEPFHSEMRAWAAAAVPSHGQVIVWEGEELTAILPDRDKPLGTMRDDHLLVGYERDTEDGGVFYDIIIMDKDDPRLAPPD